MRNHIYPFSKFLLVLVELVLVVRIILKIFGFRSIDGEGFKFFYSNTDYLLIPVKFITFTLDWGARSIEFKTFAALILYFIIGVVIIKFVRVIFAKEHTIHEWSDDK